MTTIVLPDIDRSTFEELKKRIPDLSEIELPNLPSRKEVSRTAKDVTREAHRTADETIDRLLGRKQSSAWTWIAAGIGLVALVGVVAAWFAWFRRPTWEAPAEPWTSGTAEETPLTMPNETISSESATVGRSTAESVGLASSAGSAPYPIEEA